MLCVNHCLCRTINSYNNYKNVSNPVSKPPGETQTSSRKGKPRLSQKGQRLNPPPLLRETQTEHQNVDLDAGNEQKSNPEHVVFDLLNLTTVCVHSYVRAVHTPAYYT